MSTISRRSFLKLAGVTAVAAAGASMLTGCSLIRNVTIIPFSMVKSFRGRPFRFRCLVSSMITLGYSIW